MAAHTARASAPSGLEEARPAGRSALVTATALNQDTTLETGRHEAGWRDRWLTLRDRLLASPRFQRWAARFPLTRPVARRRARALFDLCAGFVYSQILLACIRLRLLETLRDGPQTAEALAPRLGLTPEATRRLLRAAAALRLAARRGGERYGLGDFGAALLGNPGIAEMVEHHAMLYADLADPVALLRGERGGTALADYWDYGGAGADSVRARPAPGGIDYSALMSATQAMVAEQVLEAYPLGRHRCLLDVGGGDGTFIATVAGRVPGLRFMLLDLPAVAGRAAERFAGLGLAGRATTVGGSFLDDPLPTGADIVTLVRVVHDHDDAAALALLRAVRRCLPDDGTLLIAEPMADTPGAEPIGDAYFGFYLLAMGQGRPRRPAELAAMLEAAGFERPRRLGSSMPLLARILVARPAPAPRSVK